MKLNPSDYMEHAPTELGAQVHVNHEGCSSGVDRKKRLYIKRLPDNTVLAYCHHCGFSGVTRDKVGNIHRVMKWPLNTAPKAKDLLLPKDIVKDTAQWPVVVRGWLLRYGITEQEIKSHGIVYSPSINRCLLPLYMDGDYIGWQGRSFIEDRTIPKYLTTVDSSRANGNCGHYRSGIQSDTIVIVEDVLSAIKVSRQVDSTAILGSHPTPEVINWIASRYENVIIWLDNDNAAVKKQQHKLDSLFKVLVKGNVKLVESDKDPKEYGDLEIKEWLTTKT